jgi:secondary thiamine-phosphate synthase enzyme
MCFEYTQLERDTKAPGVSLHDITEDVRSAVSSAGVKNGTVTVLSRHTTTAVTINEAEPRLMDDVRVFLRKLAPP